MAYADNQHLHAHTTHRQYLADTTLDPANLNHELRGAFPHSVTTASDEGTRGTTASPVDLIKQVIGGEAALYPVNNLGTTTPALADLATLQASGIVSSTAAAWETDSQVTLDDASVAHWDGSGWVVGAAA